MNPADMPTFIDPKRFGVSFSLKQCRNFKVGPRDTLKWLIEEAGFRRFRLMSYWNEHEKEQGRLDFSELDWQIDLIEKAGGEVTLCLGARQPRWPENHWPNWAWQATKEQRTKALMDYIMAVVTRYRDRKVIVSYQLENEALLKAFGERAEVDRKRLRQEYQLVTQLDPKRPVIMTTSTSWGVPLRRPVPATVGFSFYRTMNRRGVYHHSFQWWFTHWVRAAVIRLLYKKPSFIHELQLEPWGPAAIWNMSTSEQDKSMSPQHIKTNLNLAKRTNLYPIDLWGGEWWYWRLHAGKDPTIWQAVQQELTR